MDGNMNLVLGLLSPEPEMIPPEYYRSFRREVKGLGVGPSNERINLITDKIDVDPMVIKAGDMLRGSTVVWACAIPRWIRTSHPAESRMSRKLN